MNKLDIAYLFVFCANFIFTITMAVILHRIHLGILRSDEKNTSVLNESSKAIKALRLATNEVTQRLSEMLNVEAGTGANYKVFQAEGQQTNSSGDVKDVELAQRLRNKLRDVLTQNHQIKAELKHATNALMRLSNTESTMQTGLTSIKGVEGKNTAIIASLKETAEQLRLELIEANRKTRAAERLAIENATKLEDLKEELASKQMQPRALSTKSSDEDPLSEERLKWLESREKSLLERIALLEQESQRTQAEKLFVEERFLQLSQNQTAMN